MAATTKKTTAARAQKPAAPAKAEAGKPAESRPAESERTFSVKEVDERQYVTVRNGFQGRLIYKSPRTGERFIWDAFGDEQEMELRELKNARNASKAFFVNNWFMFEEDWIIDYLGVRQYYKNAVRVEEFDEIFKKPAPELRRILEGMSEGQRHSAAYRASELIASGEIDSNKSIAVLEEVLGLELVQK